MRFAMESPCPLQVQSVVDTRLVGKAELTIDFTAISRWNLRGAASLWGSRAVQ